ncbi:hypothetical protein HJC99_01970 [Candidatus Saccharibacteria bacterium]|nr:hypothetical protein [Candidatus Saccharibacteria bacterium]
MTELPLSELIITATQLNDSQADWHFHLLTPMCTLNAKPQYALVLEDIGTSKNYVSYQAIKPFAASNQLAKMLHGSGMIDPTGHIKAAELAPDEKPIYNHARLLTDQQRPWHHHMLFPNCAYNKHAPKWTLLFEDQSDTQVTSLVSDTEPTLLLTGLEQLFYRR